MVEMTTPMPSFAGPDAGRVVLSSPSAGAAALPGRWNLLGQAFVALCQSRKEAGPNHDIWRLHHRWHVV